MTVATDTRYAPLSSVEMTEALTVVIAAMRDSPQHIAAFGPDPAIRQHKLQQMFGLMSGNPALLKHSIVALQENRIVGVCGIVAPGECQPTTSQRLRMIPGILRLGFTPARRAMTWLGAWAKQDIAEPHWHVGPVAVDPALQGQGIGSALLREAMRIVDEHQGVAYLETDKAINVTFYERQGFVVIAEQPVLNTPNWFMRRPVSTAVSHQTAA
jgi:ribosomal protein S18 acetylase RimI-like enzyme